MVENEFKIGWQTAQKSAHKALFVGKSDIFSATEDGKYNGKKPQYQPPY